MPLHLCTMLYIQNQSKWHCKIFTASSAKFTVISTVSELRSHIRWQDWLPLYPTNVNLIQFADELKLSHRTFNGSFSTWTWVRQFPLLGSSSSSCSGMEPMGINRMVFLTRRMPMPSCYPTISVKALSEWVSSFLTAHQHIIGHSVP